MQHLSKPAWLKTLAAVSFLGLTGSGCEAVGTTVTPGSQSQAVFASPPLNTAIRTLTATTEQCPTGGFVVDTFRDANANGIYDSGEVILTTNKICNGAQGLQGLGAGIEVRAGTSCAAGGSLITTYVDANNNGVRDPDEQVTSISSVCNGVAGATGATGAAGQSSSVTLRAATTLQCPTHGSVISVRNGMDAPVDTVICNGADGKDGTSASIAGTPASTTDCPTGGTTYTVTNGTGAPQSRAICNGADGQTGPAAAGVVFSTVAVAPSCPAGGTTILMANDTNHNGQLDLSDANLQTSVICNGAAGVDAQASPFQIQSIVNPCGDNPNLYDEVFMRLNNGMLIASFSDNANGANTRFSILAPGTYVTTDGDNCQFTIDSQGVVSGENHHF